MAIALLSAFCVFAQDTSHKVPDAAGGAFDMIARTPWTPLSLVALVILIVGFLIYVRMTKLHEMSRDMVEKQAEIERQQTELRKKDRDAQLTDMKTEYRKIADKQDAHIADMKKTTEALYKAHEAHLSEHKDYMKTLDKTLSELNVRVGNIEKDAIGTQKFENLSERVDAKFAELSKNVNAIDKNIATMLTILRFTNPTVYGSMQNPPNTDNS